MSPSGSVTTLTWFDEPNTNSSGIQMIRDESLTSELLLGRDGVLHGVTEMGGTLGYGRVFEMTLGGVVTTLHSFEGYYGTNGWGPAGGLSEGADGWFYGTAYNGGIKERTDNVGMGTIYKVSTNGELRTLFYFKGTNGEFPACNLVFGNDGSFYGTTPYGGPAYTNGPHEHAFGTIFKITTNGLLTTLLAFNGTNGAHPYSGLTQSKDGNFYGTTRTGGKYGVGTVFRITPNGDFSSLWSFNGTNGIVPSGLIQAVDGNLYGTTRSGGSGYGTVFQVTTNGLLSTLLSFNGTNGFSPSGELVEGEDGSLFGTTEYGGVSYGEHDNGAGTIFRIKVSIDCLNSSPPPVLPRNPQSL